MDYVSDHPGVRIHRRSDLAAVCACPARYEAESGHAPADRSPLDRGTWFHRAVESMLAEPGVQVPDLGVGLACLAAAPEAVRAECESLLRRWHRRWPPVRVLATEVLLSSEVLPASDSPDGLSHHVGGRLDLVSDPATVWDWKTSWAVPPLAEVCDDPQVLTYAVLASDRWGWQSVSVAVEFVRWGVTRCVHFDIDGLRNAAARLRSAVVDRLAVEAALAADGPAPRRPGRHCAGCPLAARCDVASPAAIRDDSDARAVLAGELQASARVSAAHAALAAWVEQHGPVEIPGAVAAYRVQRRLAVPDVEALSAALMDAGVPPWQVLRVSVPALRALVESRPELAPLVRPYVRDASTVRLAVGRPEDDSPSEDSE